MNKPDTAGVIAPPPLIFLAALVIGLALGVVAPTLFLPRNFGYVAGAILIVIAVGLLFWGAREMRRAGTPVSTRQATMALVATGPFRFSRNPLYVSLTLCYLGIAIATQALWAILLLPFVLVVIRRGVIDREERYLERKFGSEYVRYKERVRRWI
jgi:protein-S-isoprenylcysteine O-methyltransferase Ste14